MVELLHSLGMPVRKDFMGSEVCRLITTEKGKSTRKVGDVSWWKGYRLGTNYKVGHIINCTSQHIKLRVMVLIQ